MHLKLSPYLLDYGQGHIKVIIILSLNLIQYNLVETITVSFISPRPLWPWNLTTVTKLVRKSKAKCKAKLTSLSLESLQSIADVQLFAASGKDVSNIQTEVTQCLKQTCTVKTWSIKTDCEKNLLATSHSQCPHDHKTRSRSPKLPWRCMEVIIRHNLKGLLHRI